MKRATAALGPAAAASPPPPLWKPGVLEDLATKAGLEPTEAFDLRYAIDFPDEETLARRLLAPGLVVEAIRISGEEAVRRAIVGSLAEYRRPDGSYRLENEFRFLVATAQ